MAKLSGATVLTGSFFRQSNGTYLLRIRPPIKNAGASYYEDAKAFNQRLEEEIRQAPNQYYWVHRRFKSRPNGESAIY